MPERPDTTSDKKEILADLRRRLARIESLPGDQQTSLAFGISEIDSHLPACGLAFGAVHEITPHEEEDLPAAFGFLLALLGCMPGRLPLLLVLSSKKLARCGAPHGDGLQTLGLDPARVVLLETTDEAEALWATEEAIRARGPAAVAAALNGKLTLKSSQRLLHATREADVPLLLLRTGKESVATAATRWRIAASASPRNTGLLGGFRWHATLERCRNGTPGDWLLEFDHATHRFSLAAAVAHSTVARSGTAQARSSAG